MIQNDKFEFVVYRENFLSDSDCDKIISLGKSYFEEKKKLGYTTGGGTKGAGTTGGAGGGGGLGGAGTSGGPIGPVGAGV